MPGGADSFRVDDRACGQALQRRSGSLDHRSSHSFSGEIALHQNFPGSERRRFSPGAFTEALNSPPLNSQLQTPNYAEARMTPRSADPPSHPGPPRLFPGGAVAIFSRGARDGLGGASRSALATQDLPAPHPADVERIRPLARLVQPQHHTKPDVVVPVRWIVVVAVRRQQIVAIVVVPGTTPQHTGRRCSTPSFAFSSGLGPKENSSFKLLRSHKPIAILRCLPPG